MLQPLGRTFIRGPCIEHSPLKLGFNKHVLIKLGCVVPGEVLVHAVELQLSEGGPVMAVGLQPVVDGLPQGIGLRTREGPTRTCTPP